MERLELPFEDQILAFEARLAHFNRLQERTRRRSGAQARSREEPSRAGQGRGAQKALVHQFGMVQGRFRPRSHHANFLLRSLRGLARSGGLFPLSLSFRRQQ
jgi:hypothetical protein